MAYINKNQLFFKISILDLRNFYDKVKMHNMLNTTKHSTLKLE